MYKMRKESVKLWRYILRASRELKVNERQFYLHEAKTNFYAHAKEDDPLRLTQLTNAGYAKAKWVIDFRAHGRYEEKPDMGQQEEMDVWKP